MKWTSKPGWKGAQYKFASLPLAIWLIMDMVSSNTRPQSLMPDFPRYRSSILRSLGDAKAWGAYEST
jgi:hypothetical protein